MVHLQWAVLFQNSNADDAVTKKASIVHIVFGGRGLSLGVGGRVVLDVNPHYMDYNKTYLLVIPVASDNYCARMLRRMRPEINANNVTQGYRRKAVGLLQGHYIRVLLETQGHNNGKRRQGRIKRLFTY